MKKSMNRAIDKFQAAFPPNRVAVILTPAFAAASGWLSTYVAQLVPSVHLTPGAITGIFVAGALAATAAAWKWVDGWQLHEERGARK